MKKLKEISYNELKGIVGESINVFVQDVNDKNGPKNFLDSLRPLGHFGNISEQDFKCEGDSEVAFILVLDKNHALQRIKVFASVCKEKFPLDKLEQEKTYLFRWNSEGVEGVIRGIVVGMELLLIEHVFHDAFILMRTKGEMVFPPFGVEKLYSIFRKEL